MRIIAGKYKKINLNQTIDKSIRPLKDSAKESVFNVLTGDYHLEELFASGWLDDFYQLAPRRNGFIMVCRLMPLSH